MGKIKGWEKVINSQHETQWQSDNGKIVRVNSAFIPTKNGGHGWELYGTNHINMDKYSCILVEFPLRYFQHPMF